MEIISVQLVYITNKSPMSKSRCKQWHTWIYNATVVQIDPHKSNTHVHLFWLCRALTRKTSLEVK